ncbi:MAG: Rieske 2Fe-2S domain-containing protein [Polyangiaceae bacterium]
MPDGPPRGDGSRPGPAPAHGGGASIDARVDEWSRRGLTGTARSDLYGPTRDPEDISRPPDPEDELAPPRWREDFPIDWSKDEFVARRDFARFLVLTSGAFVAGQGWIAARQLLRRNRPPPPRQKVATLSELPVGGVKDFSYPAERNRCLLVRLAEQELVAFSQSCTHLSCAVVPKVDEGVFLCPCHAGYFDLRTGTVLAGPPPRPLPRILLEIEGDDVIAIGVEERMVG